MRVLPHASVESLTGFVFSDFTTHRRLAILSVQRDHLAFDLARPLEPPSRIEPDRDRTRGILPPPNRASEQSWKEASRTGG
jgi:hypothetical protein